MGEPAPTDGFTFAKTVEDKGFDFLTDRRMQGQMEQVLKPVISYLNGKKEYNEALEGLLTLFPKMPIENVQEMFNRVLNTYETIGRIEKDA